MPAIPARGAEVSLAAGARLGPYEVTSPLGVGGMGEAYRARDTRLNRDVAIKVLPAAVAGDPERLARFERAAQVLASFDHTGIGAIYGFEESGDAKALELEIVEGPMPLEEALSIARQIAGGGPRAGDRPPGSEACQHQGAARRRGESAGLRSCECPRPDRGDGRGRH